MGKMFFSFSPAGKNLLHLTICKNFEAFSRLVTTQVNPKNTKKNIDKSVNEPVIAELNKKYKLINAGDKVLDVGATSLTWLNYLSGVTNSNHRYKHLPAGRVIATDEKPIQAVEGVKILENMDFYKKSTQMKILSLLGEGNEFNLIINKKDLPTSGVTGFDHCRLSKKILVFYLFASQYLKTGGCVLVALESNGFIERVEKDYKQHFESISFIEIQSADKHEKPEIYLLAKDFLH